MIATFCLRLALGMLAMLFLLPAKQMHPRFFRTHFITALGLCMAATVMGWSTMTALPLAASTALAFVGAVAWSLDRPPLGWTLVVLTSGALIIALANVGPVLVNPK